LGLLTGAGFGTLLAAMESKKSLEQLPIWRMGLYGFLAGAALMPIGVYLKYGLEIFWEIAPEILGGMGLLGALGGGLGAAMVTLAKKSHEAELAAIDEERGRLAQP
jgi:predicted Na+-dependent transporter